MAELELAADGRKVERRSSVRFPIEQEVRYRVFSLNTAEMGTGKTVNMSSTGVLFTTDHPLSFGDRVELSIDWPAKRDHKCPLTLVATGQVVRGGNGTAAIAIGRYEFRTQGVPALSICSL